MIQTNRNKTIKIRLSEHELDRLNRCVKKTTFSREGYIRLLLSGYEPQAMPPFDFYETLKELRKIEGILKSLSERAPTEELFNEYHAASKRLSKICGELQSAFIPRKRE